MYKSAFIGLLIGCIAYLLSIPSVDSWCNVRISERNQLIEESSVDTKSYSSPKKIYPKPAKKIKYESPKEFFGEGRVSWFGGEKEYHAEANLPCSLYPKVKTKELEGNYCAIRFPKGVPIKELRDWRVHISANGKKVIAQIVDWGPAKYTKRIIDISPELMSDLGIKTDDQVRVWIEK